MYSSLCLYPWTVGIDASTKQYWVVVFITSLVSYTHRKLNSEKRLWGFFNWRNSVMRFVFSYFFIKQLIPAPLYMPRVIFSPVQLTPRSPYFLWWIHWAGVDRERDKHCFTKDLSIFKYPGSQNASVNLSPRCCFLYWRAFFKFKNMPKPLRIQTFEKIVCGIL